MKYPPVQVSKIIPWEGVDAAAQPAHNRYMEAQRAIFCLSERSLKQNTMVPVEIRRAQHRVALKMGQKLGGKLLEYKCDTQSPS
eukprot:SAG11_NODE_2787_length_2975_cov_2.383652_3_plen_84_part_00